MSKTRLFNLEWDNSKYPVRPEERYRTRMAEGVRFASGLVCLSNGAMYENMDALENTLNTAGKYTITYQDEMETANVQAS